MLFTTDRRRGLDSDAEQNRHARCDAAQNSTRVVRFRADETFFVVVKRVVIFAATHVGNIKSRAELHTFDGGNAV